MLKNYCLKAGFNETNLIYIVSLETGELAFLFYFFIS